MTIRGRVQAPSRARVGATPWMIDCEFDESGAEHPIRLISIALVSDDGREYYAAVDDFYPHELSVTCRANRARCNDWVKSNVLPYLPDAGSVEWKSREQIRADIIELVTTNAERPEFWGYYADYDWVVFCQLFGRMIDLPAGWPMFCMDLKQLMAEYRVANRDMPEDRPDFIAHHALHDARKQMDWLNFMNRFHRKYV